MLKPVETVGRYGGTLRVMHDSPAMGELKLIVNDPPVRWSRDFGDYIPGLFKGWSFNEDGTRVEFQMRRGVKWSDGGAEFTTEDIAFYWNDIAGDDAFGYIQRPWWGYDGKEFATTLEVVDPYRFALTFTKPNWNMPFLLAAGNWGFRAHDDAQALPEPVPPQVQRHAVELRRAHGEDQLVADRGKPNVVAVDRQGGKCDRESGTAKGNSPAAW